MGVIAGLMFVATVIFSVCTMICTRNRHWRGAFVCGAFALIGYAFFAYDLLHV